tara:strand:- start:125 stop:406 length:282 start_codon:yes stop_codon:yes gene_type:complete
MNLKWVPDAWEDYLFWQESASRKKTLGRINLLIKEITRTPFTGSGKPEPLKGNLKGWWSRRITAEHRLVYRVDGTGEETRTLTILQCRFHYDD